MNHIGYNAQAVEIQINDLLAHLLNSENIRDLFDQSSRKGPTRLYVKPFLYFDELNAMLVAEKIAQVIDHLRQMTSMHFFEPVSATVKRQRVEDFNRGNDIMFEFGERHNEFYYHFPKGTLVLTTDQKTIAVQQYTRGVIAKREQDNAPKGYDNTESFTKEISLHPLDSWELTAEMMDVFTAIEEGQAKLMKEVAEQIKLCKENGLSVAELKIEMSISTITRK